MAIYAMADLHLSLGKPEKSMEVFGRSWENYIPRIEENWRKTVGEDDTVLISGDISWETYLDGTVEDFKFINSLPGHKILSRGNHDYWWTSFKKMEDFLEANGLSNISFCRTNIIEAEDALVSGTRGWLLPGDSQAKDEDRKIFARETERLKLCIREFENADPGHAKKHILMIHYPPLTAACRDTDFSKIIENGQIDVCVYGHLHARAHNMRFAEDFHNGVRYILTASDFLGFSPVRVFD